MCASLLNRMKIDGHENTEHEFGTVGYLSLAIDVGAPATASGLYILRVVFRRRSDQGCAGDRRHDHEAHRQVG